jgi:hypothetical protein
MAALVYGLFSGVALAFGLAYFLENQSVFEVSMDYSDCQNACVRTFSVTEEKRGPFYIYYELQNFYQNNFMYQTSRSWDQLRGREAKSLKTCDPMTSNSSKKQNNTYVPCGAASLSVFNDSFAFSDNFPGISRTEITLSKFAALFKDANAAYRDEDHWMNLDLFEGEQKNESFINWIQTAPFNRFRKLWAKTGEDAVLWPDQIYSINIANNYPVSSFNGKKAIIIAQVKWYGGKNAFFGVFFLAMCGLCGLASIVFTVLHCTSALPLYRAIRKNALDLERPLVM